MDEHGGLLGADLAWQLASLARHHADDIHLYYVTNLRDRVIDPEQDTIEMNQLAQHYDESQINTILRGFRDIGISVHPFFDEKDFIKYISNRSDPNQKNQYTLVYSTAEGGVGAARRALIPKFCELYGLACCNAGAYGSALARHKYDGLLIAKDHGVPVPGTWLYDPSYQWRGNHRPPLGRRVILKPTYEGASIGIHENSVFPVDKDITARCDTQARLWRQPVIVQEFHTGDELGVPVIQTPHLKTCPIVRFGSSDRHENTPWFRTFQYENSSEKSNFHKFTNLTSDQVEAISQAAQAAFIAVGLGGLGRVDLRMDSDGGLYVFDINESPPPIFTTSLGFSLSEYGFKYEDMLSLILGVNLIRYYSLN